jgi:hypothetical protein
MTWLAVMGSAQVSWWDVHLWVQPHLDAAGPLPIAGTPQWCALSDTDPRKLVALPDFAQHWALRVETCQQAHAEASHAVSAAADWSAIATEIYRRRDSYIPRELA